MGNLMPDRGESPGQHGGTRRAMGYVRVSTDDQAREGVSLDVQEARIRAYCDAKGWQLVSIVRDEGKSAKDLKRPGLQELLTALPRWQRDFDALVVVKLDRLTRSVRDLGNLMDAFKRARVGFTSIQESVDTASASGELFFNLVASVSQWERRAIGERTQAEAGRDVIGVGDARPSHFRHMEQALDAAVKIHENAKVDLDVSVERGIVVNGRTIASRPGGPFPLLLIALGSNDNASTPDHRPVHLCDDASRVGLGDFDERVALAEVDLSDVITRNAAFTGDHAHQVSSLHAVARSDCHEEPSHPAGSAGRWPGTVSIRRPCARNRKLTRLGFTPLCSLALQHMERGCSQLRRVVFLQQRLE